MKPIWRLLLATLEAHRGPLTTTEARMLAWLREWRRREQEEAR